MSPDPIHVFEPSSENIVEQIVSIREYRAINRYASGDRRHEETLGNMHSKNMLPGKKSESDKRQNPITNPPFYNHETGSKSSSEFYDRFHIDDHMRIRVTQASVMTGSSYQTSLSDIPERFSSSKSVNELAKADIYELNSHQVISLKGIRVNQKA